MFRYFTENSPDYIAQIDKDLKIEYINRTSGDYKVDDLIGVPLYDLVLDEKRRPEVKEILRMC